MAVEDQREGAGDLSRRLGVSWGIYAFIAAYLFLPLHLHGKPIIGRAGL